MTPASPEELIAEIRLLGFDRWISQLIAAGDPRITDELRNRGWKKEEREAHLDKVFPLPPGYAWAAPFAMTRTAGFELILFTDLDEEFRKIIGRRRLSKKPVSHKA